MTAMEQSAGWCTSHSAWFFQVAHFMTKQDTQNPIIYNITHQISTSWSWKTKYTSIPVNDAACKSNSGLDQDCLILRFVGYVTWYWMCNTKPIPENRRVCCSSSNVLLNILVRCGLIAAETKIGRQSHISSSKHTAVYRHFHSLHRLNSGHQFFLFGFNLLELKPDKKWSRSAAHKPHVKTCDYVVPGGTTSCWNLLLQLLKVEREVFSPMDRHLQETTLS